MGILQSARERGIRQRKNEKLRKEKTLGGILNVKNFKKDILSVKFLNYEKTENLENCGRK